MKDMLITHFKHGQVWYACVGILVGSLLVATLAQAGTLYTWTDEHGKVHVSDKPPQNTTVQKMDVKVRSYQEQPIANVQPPPANMQPPLQPGSLPQQPLPSSQQLKPISQQVVMYSTTWCGFCKKAREYFQAKGIPYEEYDVEKTVKGREDFRRLKGRGVPVILVGDQRMDGFLPNKIDALLGLEN